MRALPGARPRSGVTRGTSVPEWPERSLSTHGWACPEAPVHDRCSTGRCIRVQGPYRGRPVGPRRPYLGPRLGADRLCSLWSVQPAAQPHGTAPGLWRRVHGAVAGGRPTDQLCHGPALRGRRQAHRPSERDADQRPLVHCGDVARCSGRSRTPNGARRLSPGRLGHVLGGCVSPRGERRTLPDVRHTR